HATLPTTIPALSLHDALPICMGSRGVPSPTSTSGHTETHSTYRPRASISTLSSLCPPSYRTLSPSRHWLIPTRGGVGFVMVSQPDRKSTRLNSSHDQISYAVF